MGTVKRPPIPREEPTDEAAVETTRLGEPVAEAPTTVRPPPDEPARATSEAASAAATYQRLRESCRASSTDEADLDDELAVEAEVLRIAMDRTRAKGSGR